MAVNFPRCFPMNFPSDLGAAPAPLSSLIQVGGAPPPPPHFLSACRPLFFVTYENLHLMATRPLMAMKLQLLAIEWP